LASSRRLQRRPRDAAAAEFTVLEIRFSGKATGEAKTSLTANVVVDEAARTLALGDYATAPALLRISR
jgi:hypothetical protein